MFGVYIYTFFLLRSLYSVLIGGEVETPYLPEHLIIYQILTWLPAHKAYELRCVCKSWRNIIETPEFALAHNHRAKPVLLVTLTSNKVSIPPHFKTKIIRKTEYNNIMVRNFSLYDKWIFNSCNGWILCGYPYSHTTVNPVLTNPVTKRVVKLPRTTKIQNMFCHLLGMTYVASTQKYKVIHIFNYNGINKFGIELLTVGENKWRVVHQSCATEWAQYVMNEIKFIKNVAYWVIYERCSDTKTVRTLVASYDMIAEKFRTTHFPFPRQPKTLLDINGSIGCTTGVKDSFDHFDLWVLEDFDNGKWIKQQTFVLEGVRDHVYAVAALDGPIIIFQSSLSYGYYAYDVQGMHTTYLESGSTDEILELVRAHKDTLVSLSF